MSTKGADVVPETAAGEPAEALTPERQRQVALEAVSALPMVERAAWTTQSTLEVHLLDSDADAAFEALCPLMVRHPDIASSRLQLNPPAGSDGQVRFRQCRSY